MTNPNQTSAFGIKDAMRNSGEPDLHEKNLANGDAPNNEGAEKKPSELDIALTRKWEAEARFIKTAKTRKELADAELSDWKALEADSQIGKIAAETHFISEPQTKKAVAEANLAETRRLEALAEIRRLEVEKTRLEVERLRLLAETDFTKGPRTFRETQDGVAARSQAVTNYAGIAGGVIKGIALLIAAVVVMQYI